MRRMGFLKAALLCMSLAHVCPGRGSAAMPASTTQLQPRIGVSGGLGVSYVNAVDISDRINLKPGILERASSFISAVEFYGAVSVPASPDWVLKLEYAYLLSSYNVASIYPNAEFSVVAHLPTFIVQYVLLDHGVYNVKGGAGVGYHHGSYRERYSTADGNYTGSGVGVKLDLEANTAFGEDFYGYIGADLRLDFIGTLSDDGSPGANIGTLPTLHFFSLGAKFGFTYYF